MKTKSILNPDHFISTIIQERGFYLYEWISSEEFQKSIQLDYNILLQKFGKNIAILSFIATIISGILIILGYTPSILSGASCGRDVSTECITIIFFIKLLPYIISITFSLFLLLVIFLFFKTLIKGKNYIDIANVIIVDNYIVTSKEIIPLSQTYKNKTILAISEIFHEKLFLPSTIDEATEDQKRISERGLKQLWSDSLNFANKMMDKTNGKNHPGEIIGLALFLIVGAIGIIFLGMMKIINLIFIPIIAFFSKSIAIILHKIMMIKHKKEYKIQKLFEALDKNIQSLQNQKKEITLLLQEAQDDNWSENLSGKINTVFNALNQSIEDIIIKNLQLKNELNNSIYKEIFNFGTLNRWIKKQVLGPINSLIGLLKTNEEKITHTLISLKNQIQNASDVHLQKPLILQEKRLESQLRELQNTQKHIQIYQEKLIK